MADEVRQGGGEAGRVAASRWLRNYSISAEFSGVNGVELYFGHGFTVFGGWLV